MKKPKFVQITTSVSVTDSTGESVLYALDENGDVWSHGQNNRGRWQWYRLSDLRVDSCGTTITYEE